MKAPRLPYEELVSPDNENFTATLTPRAWHYLTVLRVRARMHKIIEEVRHATEQGLTQEEADDLEDPLSIMADLAMQSSGSIGGEHRRDIVDAIQGANIPKMGLVPQQQMNGGHEVNSAEVAKRGL